MSAVGRTVVNFQRLEHNLKLLARLGPIEGILAKIQRDAEKRAERAATLTLGQAIQAWLAFAQNEPTEVGHTLDLFDPTMQATISIAPDPERLSAHGAALKKLLEIRNRLMHGGLVDFQWDSPDDCAGLVVELERVNKEISVEMEFVNSIQKGFRILAAISQENVERLLGGSPETGDSEIHIDGPESHTDS